MARKAKATKASCKRRGLQFKKIGSNTFCSGKAKKGSKKARRRTSKKGVAGMSTSERKSMLRAACKRVSAAKRKKMAGLCKWARA